MSLGIWEILIIVVLIVLVFGTKKVPTLMGDVAKGIKMFKQELASTDDEKIKAKDKDGPTPS